MAEFKCKIEVMRYGKAQELDSDQLVPGDLVLLPENTPEDFQIPCDLAVIAGQCIVDESNLTGESIPVNKTPLDAESPVVYNPDKDIFKKSTLFSGSKLL